MKISKLLLICALFGAAPLLNGECQRIGTVRYKLKNGEWKNFEIETRELPGGKKLERIDCQHDFSAGRCRAMKGNHKANMARIDNLEKYMRIFREGNSAVSEEWFAHNGSWDRFSSSTCTHNLPHS